MRRQRVLLIASVPIALTACATRLGSNPYLTKRAFERAAALCNVVSKGVYHSRHTKVPFARYRLKSGVARLDHDDGTHACLATALTNYQYDFFGEAMAKPKDD